MATEIGRLIAVFEGNDAKFHATRKRVEAGGKETSRTLEQLDNRRLAVFAANLRRQEREAAASVRRIIREARKASDAMQNIGGGSRRSSAFGSGSLLQGVAGGASALLGVSAINVIRQGATAWFEYASNLESARIAFTTMLGSARAAEDHLKQLQTFALKTPFEFPDLVAASQRMQALGFSAQQVVPVLNDVGNAVAAAGGGSERLDRVVLALSQIQSKGKVATQEMNQLAESGIPPWKMLEDQFGKSRAELAKLVEQGKISSKQFLEAFQTFSRNNFGDLMEQQSKTATGALSNLKDAIFQISERALAPLFNEIRDGLLGVSQSLLANQSSWERWGAGVVNRLLGIKVAIASVIGGLADLDRALSQRIGLNTVQAEIQNYGKGLEANQLGVLYTIANLLNMARGGAGSPATAPPEQGMGRVELNPDGTLKMTAAKPGALTSGGGGGGGGGGRGRQRDLIQEQRQFLEAMHRNTMEILKGEEEGIERSYEKRRVSMARYFEALRAMERNRHKEAMESITAEIALAKNIRDSAQRDLALLDLDTQKRQEINRHAQEEHRLAGQVSEVTRERIALTDTLIARMTREREVLKEIVQERTRFASEIARQELGGGSFELTPEMRDSIGRPRVATVERQVADERFQQIREQMRQLAYDLTSVLDQAIYDGFEGGLKRGFQTLTVGLLRMVQEIFLERLRAALAEALTGIGTGGGGGGFWGRLLGIGLSALTGGFTGGVGGGGKAVLTPGSVAGKFAGSFASGGLIPSGQWGMVHEGEHVVASPYGARVIPSNKGVQPATVIYNINVPVRAAGSYSSPQSRRQFAEDIMSALQGATA